MGASARTDHTTGGASGDVNENSTIVIFIYFPVRGQLAFFFPF